MQGLAKLGAALQTLFGPVVEEAARVTGVIVRRRKFTSLSLARTFVLGFLHKPDASDEDLARIAVQCGADVAPQAVAQRHTPKMVQFLAELFRLAARQVFGSHRSLAPLLERFTAVTVLDSSTITLPDALRKEYPGCGGSHGGGAAAMKLQTELDLRIGALSSVTVEPGRLPDGGSARQQAEQPAGSLRIADLGYFSVPVLAAIAAAKAYFLSRLQFRTGVRLAAASGAALDVLEWLKGRPGPYVDEAVHLGAEKLPCRLIAWRLPAEQADRRRRKLKKEMKSKYGREPSVRRLAWCDWTILVTNALADRLTPPEATVLYRARWQVELLFKRWKSQGLVAVLSGSTVERQMVRVWSRLLAALVQHWLVVGTCWGDATRSWVKAGEAARGFVTGLLAALDDGPALERVLTALAAVIAKTCRRNKRSKPGTVELLNNIGLLDFSLA